MPNANCYQLRIIGEDFVIRMTEPDDPDRIYTALGFVTTRWIEAATPRHAAMAAFALVRHQLSEFTLAPGQAPPRLTVAYVSPVESLAAFPAPGTGFTFFASPPTQWDRFREHLRELRYRIFGNRPWTYSELF